MSSQPGGREAYLNAAALVRAHHNHDSAAEHDVVAQLDGQEREHVIGTLTSVATWLLNAYARSSGVPPAAALDLLLETIDDEATE